MTAVTGIQREPSGGGLLAAFRAVRAHSEMLAAPLSAEDCTIQSMPDASPGIRAARNGINLIKYLPERRVMPPFPNARVRFGFSVAKQRQWIGLAGFNFGQGYDGVIAHAGGAAGAPSVGYQVAQLRSAFRHPGGDKSLGIR